MINQTKIVNFLRFFLGATFILSSIAKIYSLKFFDELVAKQLIGDDYFEHLDQFYWVQWLTRIMIAGEFMLGIAVLQDRYIKKIVLPFMIGLLILFTAQVFFEAEVHNKGYIGGNCGCFGEVIPFDNFETIIKNIVLVAMAAFVFFKYKEEEEKNFPPILIPFIVGVVTLFTLSRTFNKPLEAVKAVDMTQFTTEVNDSLLTKDTSAIEAASISIKDSSIILNAVEGINNKTKSSSIFANYTKFSGGVVKDLDKGTHLICLFSFSCGHCQDAYKDILALRKKGAKTGEVYIIGYGSEFDEKSFWNATGGKSPFIRIENDVEFAKLRQGDDFPKIMVVKNNKIQKVWDYSTYSKESLYKQFGFSALSDIKIPNKNGINIENPKDNGSLIIDEKEEKSILDF